MKDIYIFAIESSCDETSASIIKNGNNLVQEFKKIKNTTLANFILLI